MSKEPIINFMKIFLYENNVTFRENACSIDQNSATGNQNIHHILIEYKGYENLNIDLFFFFEM